MTLQICWIYRRSVNILSEKDKNRRGGSTVKKIVVVFMIIMLVNLCGCSEDSENEEQNNVNETSEQEVEESYFDKYSGWPLDGKTNEQVMSEGVAEDSTGNVRVYDPSWTEEEIMDAINERSQYYKASAYYSEIIDYWENIREVRDISNLMEPLFETDRKYYTKEEFEREPMLVIHLAKNEIYARHGYIFKNTDLYNYFMGCIWYNPTCSSKDFSDSVFNEYEKANLEILTELDTY